MNLFDMARERRNIISAERWESINRLALKEQASELEGQDFAFRDTNQSEREMWARALRSNLK